MEERESESEREECVYVSKGKRVQHSVQLLLPSLSNSEEKMAWKKVPKDLKNTVQKKSRRKN
jgi:hypothetical protein